MSQFLQINSLLNIGNGRRGSKQHGDGNSRESEMSSRPASSSSSAFQRGSELLPPPAGYPRQEPHVAVPPNARAGNTHAVRDQSIYTMSDYRYWPYTRYSSPMHAPQGVFPAMQSPDENFGLTPTLADAYADPRRMYLWSRQRRTRACQNCHVKKVKCEGDGGRCFNCVRANIECKWIPMKKRGPKPKSKLATSSSASSMNSAIQLPLASETPYNGLGLGLGLGISAGAASRPHTSRATSATNTASPHIGDQHRPSSSQRASRSVSCSQPAPLSDTHFYQIVMDSEGGELSQESVENTMRRFYSDEVTERTRNAVVYYFEYFYAICPIFHPALFIRRIVDGEVDQILIDSMCASAARLINRHTGSSIDIDQLIEDTDMQLLSYLSRPSIDYVRAVVIMASLNGGECRFMMYNALACLAASLVTRLGWHMLDARPISPDITWREWISIEIKRRTYFVVYQIDGYLSMLSDRSMTVPESRCLVHVPGSGPWWDNLGSPRISGHVPSQFDPNMSKEDVVKSGSLVHSFVDLCSLNRIISQVNDVLWKLKLGLPTYPHGDDFKPDIKFFKCYTPEDMNVTLPIRSLFEIGEFRRIHQMLDEWQRGLVSANKMKDIADTNHAFSSFGSYTHRIHQMRIRYFCLYTYSVPVMHYLHLANRPSFFETQSPNKVFADSPDVASLALTDAPENKAIYDILSNVFTERLNSGLLAYDVINESWRICVDVVYDLVRHLDCNQDIPLERYDQVMPFCLLTSMTVLIRNARICKHVIETSGDAAKVGNARDDLVRSTAALRRLWTLLGDLNHVWRVEGVEYLMRIMQVEEVVNAADLLSGLSL
ncbi:hypothetical protein H4S01_001808 [Coemansia sp. RSA 2610]|nr:hypothetical protein H4S01_001808 [Coemansia sp. RSA 2610]